MRENETVLHHHGRRSVDAVCPRCDSDSVASSRYRGLESLFVAVFPFNVCRCVECYNRFWVRESLFSNIKRLWVWGVVAVLLVSFVLLIMQQSAETVNLNRSAELISVFEEPLLEQKGEDGDSPEAALSDVLSDVRTAKVDDDDRLFELASGQSDDPVLLNNAKTLSQRSSVAQQKSLERLEKAIDEDKGALESLIKVELNYRVERWSEMWQSGLVDYYLVFYSKDFQPNKGLSFDVWAEQRKKRITPEKKIKVELSNFDVSFSNDMKKSVMVFHQLYSSHSYSEKSRKKLVWIKEASEWKIVSETELSN